MWVYDGNSKIFYRITGVGQSEATNIVPPFEVIDYAATPLGLLVLGRQDETNYLFEYAPDGTFLVSYPMPDRWLQGLLVALHGKNLAIAGSDGSGPNSFSSSSAFHVQATHLWMRTLPAEPTETGSTDVFNAGVTAVLQGSPVDATSWMYIDYPQVFYNLSGGQFQVQVTNYGSTMLEEIAVNIVFDSYVEIEAACFQKPSHHRRYYDLDLAPGASVWLDFGDIYAPGQESLQHDYCFWTSAPNTRPDAQHEDDHFCHPVVYSVATAEALDGALRLYPNPSTGDLYLEWETGNEAPARYEIFDLSGRQVKAGSLDSGQNPARISVDGLPNGMYWIKAGGWQGKVVIQ